MNDHSFQISELYFTITIGIFCLSLVLAWAIGLHKLGANAKELIKEGSVLKIIAAVIIVVAAGMLAIIGKVNGDAALTLMSGVAGYILGSQVSALRKNSAIIKDNTADNS